MMKFRFKVSDGTAKRRVGNISAVDIEAARKAVESQGYTVLELEPLKTQAISSPRRSSAMAYRPDALELLERLERSPQKRRAVFTLLLFLGLALWLTHRPSSSLGTLVTASASERPIRLVLSGTVEIPLAQRPTAAVHLRMPELPLEISRTYEGLVDDVGGYRLEYEFEGGKAPTYFEATLTVDGKKVDQTSRVSLSGEPLTGQAPELRGP
jgi:hypothetical protein